MKALCGIISMIMLGAPAASHGQEAPNVISLQDVVKRVSNENYAVYGNALRVYQAQESIAVARGNLLPQLNLWKIASVVVNWLAIVDLAQDIAPFLVPANWFRLKQTEIFYHAESEGYRALWANELMTAKSLYLRVGLDHALMQHIENNRRELEELLPIIRSRELFGGVIEGASRDVEIRMLALQEDRRSLEVLAGEEEGQLSYLMGLPADQALRITPIALPEYSELQPLAYNGLVSQAIQSSPELRQYSHIIEASAYLKHEAIFSVLGTSSMSRGVAGGVFDNLPQQNGLGFGTPAQLRIASAQTAILEIQRKGIEETIKRHLKLLVNSYNLDLENYANLSRRVALVKKSKAQLYERLYLGQMVAAIDLIEGSRNQIQAETALIAIKYRFVANQDKLSRLLFQDDYANEPRKPGAPTPPGRKGS